MSDWTDEASVLEERQRQAALDNRIVYQGESLGECAECGDLISSARQIAVPGCTMCTECASMLEQRR